MIAYPGDHTLFEAPPLVAGHGLRGDGEAEVGVGLAQALGLGPGSTLAIALPSGDELRLRVAGVVSSLDHDGHVAYIPAAALLRADPSAPSLIAIALHPGADVGPISAALTAARGDADDGDRRDRPWRSTGLDLALDRPRDRDRRRSRLRLRARAGVRPDRPGAPDHDRGPACLRRRRAGSRLLIGAMLALVIPAAIAGVALQRWLLGPALSHLAADYRRCRCVPAPARSR